MPPLAAEHRPQDVRVLDVRLLDVGRIDALDGERAALLAVEQRPEDEARVGARPAQPLDGALLEERAVRAVPDDGEASRHVSELYSRARRLYLLRTEGGALARHAGHHGLVIASNRLPVRLTIAGRRASRSTRSSGGLAAALQAVRGDATWVGWPGTVVPPAAREARRAAARARPPRTRCSSRARRGGGLLQPRLQRHALAALPLLLGPAADHARGVGALRRGERALRGRDPRALRAGEPRLDPRLPPDARPGDAAPPRARGSRSASSCTRRSRRREVYRLLPAREQLLRGVLGADYVSFQIGDYARHFRSSCLRILGIDSEPDWLEIDGRRVGIGVDPIGIDVEGFRETLAEPGDGAAPRRARAPVRGTPAHPRRRAARLHEGDPAEAAGVRALPRAAIPNRARTTTMIQVLVPVAAREPGVPGAARRDRAPHRAHQRPLRPARARRPSSTSTATSRSRRSSRSTGART